MSQGQSKGVEVDTRREYYRVMERVTEVCPAEAAAVDRWVRVLAEQGWRLQERAQRAEGRPAQTEGPRAESRAAYRSSMVARVCELTGVEVMAAESVVLSLMPELNDLDPAPFLASSPQVNEVKVESRRRLAERADLVEKTLLAVWRWSTFDGVNVEALRNILRSADPDAGVHAALDALIRSEAD